MNKLWLTKKLIIVYDKYEGDKNNPNSWICTSKFTGLPSRYEVESLYESTELHRVFIRAWYMNKYWYAWIDTELLEHAPVRYMIRPTSNSTNKWES